MIICWSRPHSLVVGSVSERISHECCGRPGGSRPFSLRLPSRPRRALGIGENAASSCRRPPRPVSARRDPPSLPGPLGRLEEEEETTTGSRLQQRPTCTVSSSSLLSHLCRSDFVGSIHVPRYFSTNYVVRVYNDVYQLLWCCFS